MEQITIRDIAKKCGVGVSTVSRALNNHPDINPETKEMILKVMSEYNYVPNNSARNLKRSDAKAIAVLVKGMDNMFFNNMISILEEQERKSIPASLSGWRKRRARWMRPLRSSRKNGSGALSFSAEISSIRKKNWSRSRCPM